jgi:hypothetical protein
VRIAFRGTRRLISLIHMSCDFFGLHQTEHSGAELRSLRGADQ